MPMSTPTTVAKAMPMMATLMVLSMPIAKATK